ncbi:MAG: type I-E CRISPR-associated protein Cas5/CasD [Sphaerochaeta sp.]|nr:type I-E CRISPR-associated protein Cas5/CasD [Sphaerochaeta sp.]
MERCFLVLWLEAPLQSWGSSSKFSRRDTEQFPTKSGIFGLLLSSMGARGVQAELLLHLSQFRQVVVSYGKEKKSRPSMLMDFHMVGSGYDEKDAWQKNLIPKKADGKASVGGGAKMTYRYYLQDARFAVIQELDVALAEEIERALKQPTYDVFLGKKHCIPTDFVYRGTYSSFDEAWKEASVIAAGKNLVPLFQVADAEASDPDAYCVLDAPKKYGEQKQYAARYVVRKELNGYKENTAIY